MRRRDFITLLGSAAAWPLAARAQQSVLTETADRMRKIGIFQGLAPDDPEFRRRVEELKQGLAEFGWIDGRNTSFEYRHPAGQPDRLLALAAELVHANVDVIVANGAQYVQAAREATSTVPIVMTSAGDAVEAGLVSNLARPGGNVTGLTLLATDTKRLELLKEMLPRIAAVAALWNARNGSHALQLKEMEAAATKLGIQIQSSPVRDASDIEAKFAAIERSGAQALATFDDQLIQSNRQKIVSLAMRQKLPVIGEGRNLSQAGAIFSYGASISGRWRRAATYVDKIFKGVKPADLPVEQPTHFELVINLKSAKMLSLTIPESFLLRADEVIE
jgi:putative ABC transport system substrate-binding protein